jgi:hypothetical protein
MIPYANIHENDRISERKSRGISIKHESLCQQLSKQHDKSKKKQRDY